MNEAGRWLFNNWCLNERVLKFGRGSGHSSQFPVSSLQVQLADMTRKSATLWFVCRSESKRRRIQSTAFKKDNKLNVLQGEVNIGVVSCQGLGHLQKKVGRIDLAPQGFRAWAALLALLNITAPPMLPMSFIFKPPPHLIQQTTNLAFFLFPRHTY